MPQPERDRAPDAERGPTRKGPRPDSQPTAKRADTPEGTPHPARLTWNGHPGLLPIYARRRGWFDPELERLLRDHEAAALAIFDAIGRQRSRDVARRLLELCEEVA